MDLKYLTTTVIAVTALALSGIVEYFQNLRRLEELRVVVSNPILPVFEDKQASKLMMPPGIQLAFINSGNTSLAVTGAYATIGHNADRKVSNDQECESDASFDTDLEPFVLKQSDVVVRKITFLPNENFTVHKAEKSLTFDLTDGMKKSRQAGFCMRFALAVPSDPLAGGEVVLGRFDFNTNPDDSNLSTGMLRHNPFEPDIVWHATRFVFS
jgi:hypothetical protein